MVNLAKWIYSLMLVGVREFFPFVWHNISKEHLNTFARQISPDKVIESMCICFIWFGPDQQHMADNICHLHIDEKDNALFSEVVFFQW